MVWVDVTPEAADISNTQTFQSEAKRVATAGFHLMQVVVHDDVVANELAFTKSTCSEAAAFKIIAFPWSAIAGANRTYTPEQFENIRCIGVFDADVTAKSKNEMGREGRIVTVRNAGHLGFTALSMRLANMSRTVALSRIPGHMLYLRLDAGGNLQLSFEPRTPAMLFPRPGRKTVAVVGTVADVTSDVHTAGKATGLYKDTTDIVLFVCSLVMHQD